MSKVILDTEDGFADFTIPVLHSKELEDGIVSVRVQGSMMDDDIGFYIDVLPNWRPQVVDSNLTIYWGNVRYRTIGSGSDRFLSILADHYGFSAQSRTMAPMINFTAAGLQTDPREIKSIPLTMKLFFDQGPEGTYAEFFTNIDLKGAKMEFREKDEEYRARIVSAFEHGNYVAAQ